FALGASDFVRPVRAPRDQRLDLAVDAVNLGTHACKIGLRCRRLRAVSRGAPGFRCRRGFALGPGFACHAGSPWEAASLPASAPRRKHLDVWTSKNEDA